MTRATMIVAVAAEMGSQLLVVGTHQQNLCDPEIMNHCWPETRSSLGSAIMETVESTVRELALIEKKLEAAEDVLHRNSHDFNSGIPWNRLLDSSIVME
ncbi:hypothetical protein L2E82_01628 [Cichorium intybus]|uniref:Uncharacterized protein n=1 Tax=Cichorium intybus TaxID=13427 RepID=A0ACB9GZE8_CICIN|nr:hypothetical protein L2E82_01628 [Cichorium intybus]